VLTVAGRAPSAFGHTLCTADLLLGPLHEIAIIGDADDDGFRALFNEVVSARLVPNTVVAVASASDEGDVRVPLLAGRTTVEGRATAYVCRGFVCERPVTSTDDLAALLT
jgi:uncharacterized protein YyaL (SSP411 family)